MSGLGHTIGTLGVIAWWLFGLGSLLFTYYHGWKYHALMPPDPLWLSNLSKPGRLTRFWSRLNSVPAAREHFNRQYIALAVFCGFSFINLFVGVIIPLLAHGSR
jgi:hypothetical protein